MAETPNDKPKNPNIQRPVQPSNNKASEQKLDKLAVGIGELNKTLKEILGNDNERAKTEEDRFQGEEKEERLKALMMRKNLIGVKESVDKNTEEITKTIKGSTKQTAEEKKEEKDNNKKFLSTLTEMFDGIKKGLTGATSGIDLKPLLAVWTFFKKLAKMALIFGVGGILANIKLEDIKKIWNGIKELFTKTKEFLAPIVKQIGIYFEKTLIPVTVKTLLSTFDNIGTLLDDLTTDFDGWTKKDNWGKFWSLTGALHSLGKFILNFSFDIIDAFFNLVGYNGSITNDIKGHFTNVFGPNFSTAIFDILAFLVGTITIANIFGFSKKQTAKNIGKILWAPFSLLLGALGSIASTIGLWAWYLSGGIISLTTGIMVGIPLLLTGLAVYYNDEITRGLATAMDSVTNWFTNLPAMVNNALVGTKFGNFFGLEKMDLVETKTVKDDYENARNQRAKATQTLSGLESKYASRKGGPQGGAGPEWTEADSKKLAQAKIDKKKWDDIWREMQVFAPMIDEGETKPKPKPDITLQKFLPKLPTIMPMDNYFDPTSQDAVSRLKGDEKFMPESYKDRDTRSVGYGFNLKKPGAQGLLDQAGIDATVDELWNKKKSITEEQATRLLMLETGYFKDQAMKYAGPGLWSQLSKSQKEALHNMHYQMGSMDDWDGLKSALLLKDNEMIDWEIMKNSELGKTQTPRRAQKYADMLQFNNVPNETGGSLYANNIPRTATGTPMIISQDYSQNSSGDSVTFGSGGSPYQNRDVVSQQKYNLKTSV